MVQRYTRSVTFNDSLKFYKASLGSWNLGLPCCFLEPTHWFHCCPFPILLNSRRHHGCLPTVSSLTWFSKVRTLSSAAPSCPARFRFSCSSLWMMSRARVGVVSRASPLILSGGSSVIRYSSPYLPGTSLQGILPSLIRRLTVLGDRRKAMAAWAMVNPSLSCIALPKGYTLWEVLSSCGE